MYSANGTDASLADATTLLGLTEGISTLESVTANVDITNFDDTLAENRNENHLSGVFFEKIDTTNDDYTYTNLVNTVAPEASAIFNQVFNEAIIRQATNNSDFELKAT